MINSEHRFHGHKSLSYVYHNGRVVRGPLTALKYVPNDRRPTYRLAVVVSKKVNKRAVVRNRIRRRLYESFRQYEPQVQQPHDIVITVFSEAILELSPDKMHALVGAQLHQSGII